MKIKKLSILCCLAICCLFATVACHEDAVLPTSSLDETGSLTLQFQLTPASVTRGDGSGVTELFYTVQDGELVPCEAPKAMPTTKAIGDGVVADGGGMADLHVFLVDAADKIVARQSFSYSTDPTTTQEVTFRGLTRGATYTAYAYANTDAYTDTERNDWFTMPGADETFFATYKNALLKPLNKGEAPTIANGRMPLTGKQEFTITSDTLCTIKMLRPVARLEVNVKNQRSDVVIASDINLGNLFPQTGYVFKHDNMIYPKGDDNEPFSMIISEGHPILSGNSLVVFNTLLYETKSDTDTIKISMKYAGANDEIQESENSLKQISETTRMVIKLFDKDNTDPSKDHFLGVKENADNSYSLVLVSAANIDNHCIWYLDKSSAVHMALRNDKFGQYIDLASPPSLLSSESVEFKLNKPKQGNAFLIGDNKSQLTYTNDVFSVTNDGSLFLFCAYIENAEGSGSISNKPINIEEESTETQSKPLTAIYRNQHVKINIVFQDKSAN